MNTDKRLFTGGMDRDTDPHFIKSGDYRYALNCIVGNDETGNLGAVSNAKGTEEVSFTLPTGDNKCIGSFNDDKNNRVIFFIYNSTGLHSIYEYNVRANNVSLIMESSALNFDWQYRINDIDLVDDNLLYWTDGYNPPRKLNIKKMQGSYLNQGGVGYSSVAQTGSIASTIQEVQDTLAQEPFMVVEEYVDAIKYAPYKEPIIEYFTNPEISSSNTLANKAFQFRYTWIYDDNEHSVWSPLSKVEVQNDLANYFTSSNLTSTSKLSSSSTVTSASGTETNIGTWKQYSDTFNGFIPTNISIYGTPDNQGTGGPSQWEEEFQLPIGTNILNSSYISKSNNKITINVDNVYNLTLKIDAKILEDTSGTIANKPMLKWFNKPSDSSHEYTINHNSSNYASIYGSNPVPTFSYGNWVKTSRGNSPTYSNGSVTYASNWDASYPTYASPHFTGWIFDEGSGIQWNKGLYNTYPRRSQSSSGGHDSSSFASSVCGYGGTVGSGLLSGPDTVAANPFGSGTHATPDETPSNIDITFNSKNHPPSFLRRALRGYSLSYIVNVWGTNQTETISNIGMEILYREYNAQAVVDTAKKSIVKIYRRYTDNSGIVVDTLVDTINPTDTSYQAVTDTWSGAVLESGETIEYIAKRYSHIYESTTDNQTREITRKKVSNGLKVQATSGENTISIEPTNFAFEDVIVEKKNSMSVTVHTGSELVKSIKVAVRDMEQGVSTEFYKIAEINKESLNLQDYSTYAITFNNNNTIKEIIDVAETNRLYDFVPRLAGTQTYLSNNRIAYGNILEGFDTHLNGIASEQLDVNLIQDYRVRISDGNQVNVTTNNPFGDITSPISGEGTVNAGQFNSKHHTGSSHGALTGYFFMGFDRGDALTPNYLYEGYPSYAPGLEYGHDNISTPTSTSFTVQKWGGKSKWNCNIDPLGNINQNKPTLKRGGKYTYGLVYFDRAGRSSMVNTYSNEQDPKSMTLNIPWFSERIKAVTFSSDYNLTDFTESEYASWWVGDSRLIIPPNVFWEIKHKPPKWATHYQWVRTKNEAHDYFIQGFTGGPVDEDGDLTPQFLYHVDSESEEGSLFVDVKDNVGAIKYMDINVEYFYNYSKYTNKGEDSSIMNYSFNKGDLIRFIGWKQRPNDMRTNARYTGDPQTVWGHPVRYSMVKGYGLYKEYIEFKIADVFIHSNGATYFRLEGDFNILNQDLYYSGRAAAEGFETSYTDSTRIYRAFHDSTMFEIYRPKDDNESSEKIYYEIGETFKIGNPHSSSRYHKGEFQDQLSGKPARGGFGARYDMIKHPYHSGRYTMEATRSYGDVYSRRRPHIMDDKNKENIQTLTGAAAEVDVSYDESSSSFTGLSYLYDEMIVQDAHINDTVPKHQITSGSGRPHIENNEINEEWNYATVRFSEPYVEGTGLLGLNTFYESQIPSLAVTSGYVDYEKEYGTIQKIISRETDLVILHENKTTKAMVGKQMMTGADGLGNMTVSAVPLSEAVPFVGDFGVGLNPESVAIHNNAIYFVDTRRGSVLRLSRDGITPISEYGMHIYFKDKCRDIINSDHYSSINGIYNRDYNEYTVTFDSGLVAGSNITPSYTTQGGSKINDYLNKKNK